jgi:hypothetical protein
MNERIRELYDQSIVVEGNGDYVAGELDPKKFAELIIEECASLFPLQFTDEPYQRRIDKTIRKHFGAEQ